MHGVEKKFASELARSVAALCVRNTFLEELHAGTTPASKTGDYSDVKVVTPYGEIPWQQLSRISDEEMKRLMKESVNRGYTFFSRRDDLAFNRPLLAIASRYRSRWDAPE